MKKFHVDRLAAYSGTAERVLEVAMLDTVIDPHLVERIMS